MVCSPSGDAPALGLTRDALVKSHKRFLPMDSRRPGDVSALGLTREISTYFGRVDVWSALEPSYRLSPLTLARQEKGLYVGASVNMQTITGHLFPQNRHSLHFLSGLHGDDR